MAGNAPNDKWFEEFKRVNSSTHDAEGSPPKGRGERRQHPRFCLHDATVKLYRRGATAIFGLARLSIEGAVVDLSEGGVRFETDEKFLVDTKVRLKIAIVKFNDTVESDGVTRWCHTDIRNPERFQVGVAFMNPDPTIVRKIATMRGWYTSAQYRSQLAQHLREQKRV